MSSEPAVLENEDDTESGHQHPFGRDFCTFLTLDQLTWLRLYWASLFDQSIKRQNPSEVNLPPAISVPTARLDEKDFAITDCKSLYDLTT